MPLKMLTTKRDPTGEIPKITVANPRCLSRILIFSIPDPGALIQQKQKKMRGKQIFYLTFEPIDKEL
jgi:hypothetical protein